jgi:hypothetical protein
VRLSLFIVLALACRRQPPVTPREPVRPPPKPIAQKLTPDVALSRIASSYLGGMQRCYRARLKQDASARGNVIVTFTVDESGRLAYRDARGVGKALEQCVERAMLRWSFPPPDEQMTFRLAFRLSSRS